MVAQNNDIAGKADTPMTRTSLSLALMALLAACGDGQPLFDEEEAATSTDPNVVPFEPVAPNEVDEPEDVLNSGTIAPPLRGALAARGDIVRAEATNTNGGGATSLFSYNGTDDLFVIDGLAFDGLNEYARFEARPQLGNVAVYRGDVTVTDSLTGTPVSQIVPYFALYDTSDAIIDNDSEDGAFRTSFAIVRTAGYDDYGFGTYAYQRAGGFLIPTEGQATFSGTYAGLRVNDTFSATTLDNDPSFSGDVITSADINIDIDFDDFNGTPGIKGEISNRRAFNQNGEELEVNRDIRASAAPISAIHMPNLPFVIRDSGVSISENGEIGGNVQNTIIDRDGNIRVYESGTYQGILAGDMTDANDGGEIVGVLVFEAEDSRFEGVFTQETGGFIATR